MQKRVDTFITSLDARVEEIANACTACGACASVCPTLAVAGIEASDPEALTAGVRDILRGNDAPEAAKSWARTCCSSGQCLTVCDYGINPRFMLTMARRAMNQNIPADERRDAGKAAFQKMSRGVRVISRLTLPPDLLARLTARSQRERDAAPDFIFYTGCNMLKTPHIGLLCLEVLDRLGITYDVQGGPGSCCGILQTRPGDAENAGRQAFSTLDKFAATGASKILSWCPTCQIQFGETMIPSYREATGTAMDIGMFPVYLASRLDELQPLMTRPVNKRVAIYEYAGELGVMEAVRTLLGAVPGVQVVEIETSSIGYNGTSLAPLGSYHRDNITGALDDAEAAGVDAFVGIYHGDHRELAGHEATRPFRIVNYMELVGESMGIAINDRFKELKLMQDADAIVAASMDQIIAHGLDPERVRAVVVDEMIEG
jgi:heterodisulfide reductase subunit D